MGYVIESYGSTVLYVHVDLLGWRTSAAQGRIGAQCAHIPGSELGLSRHRFFSHDLITRSPHTFTSSSRAVSHPLALFGVL